MQNSQPLNTMQTADFCLVHQTHPFQPLFMNVVDYVTSEIGLFRNKLYLPKTTSTRRQYVEIALISGILVSIDVIKTKQDKLSTMQPIPWSVTLERFRAITRHASEITLTLNSLFKLTL